MNSTPYDEHSSSRTSTPSLDLYYHQDFKQHQSLTANVVGTYIRTTGDAEAVNDMRTSSLYLFSLLKGHLGKLGYMGGLGVSRRYYRQGDSKDNFWLFRPKFTVSYPLAERLKLKYDFEISQHVSQIALVSDNRYPSKQVVFRSYFISVLNQRSNRGSAM